MPNLIRNIFLFVWVLFVCSPIARASEDAYLEEVIVLRHEVNPSWNSIEIGLTIDGQEDAAKLYASSGDGKLKELRINVNLPDIKKNFTVPQDLLIGVYEPRFDTLEILSTVNNSQSNPLSLRVMMNFGGRIIPSEWKCSDGRETIPFYSVTFSFSTNSKIYGRRIGGACDDFIDEREATLQ